MVAFGVGELGGILGGIALGVTFIETMKVLFGVLTAIILAYGVWYWNDRFSRSDLVKSFSDFVKVAVWVMYVSGVFYLFYKTTNLKVDFYPAFINAESFTKGIQISLPDGTKSVVDVDRPYTSLTLHNVPLLYSLLEFPDALETLLITKFTLSVDRSGWDGYFANSPDPTKVFSKCVFNALSQVDPSDAVAWICFYGQGGGEMGIGDVISAPLNPAGFLYKSGVIGIEGICRGLNLSSFGAISKVNKNVESCLLEEKNRMESYFVDRKKELLSLYDSGKISEQDYIKQSKELKSAQEKWESVFNQMTEDGYSVFASHYAEQMIKETADAPLPRSIENSNMGVIKSIVEWVGEKTTQMFVGEYLLLDLFEAFQKFSLVIEVGIVLPLLFLLSMLPNANSPTGSSIGFAVKGLGIYFLVKLARVLVFLVYLVAHNYFIANALAG